MRVRRLRGKCKLGSAERRGARRPCSCVPLDAHTMWHTRRIRLGCDETRQLGCARAPAAVARKIRRPARHKLVEAQRLPRLRTAARSDGVILAQNSPACTHGSREAPSALTALPAESFVIIAWIAALSTATATSAAYERVSANSAAFSCSSSSSRCAAHNSR